MILNEGVIMTKPLAIIVPIYNVEKYLKECLESIKNQTYSNFQAILINDGSTDRSAEIAMQYTKLDSRFLLINQENKGLGEARNSGLDFVFSPKNTQETEYIGLVDSDDVIAKDYYENLIYCLESNNAMIAKSRDVYVFKDINYSPAIFDIMQSKEKGIVRKVNDKNLTSKIDPPRSLFKASLIKDLRFPSVRFAEDVPFGVCANVLAQRIALTKRARYFYRMREGSLTKRHHPPQEFFKAFAFIYNFFLEHNLLLTYTLPTHIIRPSIDYDFFQDEEKYFVELQEFIQSLHIDSKVLDKNPVLKAALQTDNVKDFLKKTQTFKEWRRNNFRIHLSRKQKIIQLFGKKLL